MTKYTKAIAAGVLALLSSWTIAQSFEDQKAVLEAQTELARKQSELNNALRALAGSAGLTLPTVLSITQFGDQSVARLLLPNGGIGHFHEGDTIQRGMILKAIAPKKVVVWITKGKKPTPIELDFAMITPNGNPLAGGMNNPNAAGSTELLPEPAKVTVPAIAVVPTTPAAPAKAPTKTPASAPAAGAPEPALTREK